jgi:hypothetical protein
MPAHEQGVTDEDPRDPGEAIADFDGEGLLDGLDEPERSARVNLLRQLTDVGVSVAELRQAVVEDRLALLPIQQLLDRNARYTLREYSELTGLSEEFLQRDYPALGLPAPQSEDRWFSEEQVAAGQMLKLVMDAGVPEERVIELARTVGRTSAVVAEAVLQMFAEVFLRPGDTELDLGLRFAALAESLMPAVRPLIGNVVELHMRHLVSSEVIDRTTRITRPATRIARGHGRLCGSGRLHGAGRDGQQPAHRGHRSPLRHLGRRRCRAPCAPGQAPRRCGDVRQL